MKFTAGDTITIEIDGEVLTIKVEDASKGESITGKVESAPPSSKYSIGEICDFERAKIRTAD